MFALNFLGQVEAIGADGAPLPLVSEKQISLLAYLAMTGETYTRPQLETLLWGEAAQENAQTSLRTAVYKLNKQFDGILKTTRKTIELDLEKVNSVDAIEFEEAISKEGIAALEQAVGIYQGEFLAGIIVPDSSEFEYWLLQTRERLRLALLSGLETLIENHSTLRQYEEAITYARQFLEIEPWQESIHRHLMLLLARTGQYAEALKQYQLCTEALEKELGVPPMAETVALYQRIVALRDRPNPLIPPSPYHLIGRDDALADIEALLAAPKNRIIVLTGMGGIGKTTLVKSLARRQAAHYLEGIYFIELADLESPSLLETTVSTAFSLTPPPSVSPLNHLATHLKEQEILLIIDNAEHLLSAVERLSQILIDAVSQLTIVITSREKLNLRTAVHYPLEGLSPTKEADNPAIQLFAEHAGQIDPDFKLADELETVAEICKLVGGVPLGIELAAAQLDIHSSDELLAELRASLTDLAVEYHDMPPRHRSMRALFNHTQALMTPAEQAALTKLAVFRGGFTREMADAVSGVSSKLLRRLIAKSLLQKRDDRFTIHTLIRQFALERLPEDDPIYAAHAERFCEEIVMLNEQPIGELLNFINEERENVRAMWQYGINHRSEKILGETTHPLARYYAGTHQFNEGNIIYEQAVDPLRQTEFSSEAPRVWGLLLGRYAMTQFRLGELEHAKQLCQESADSLMGFEGALELPFSLNLLSITLMHTGRFEEAIAPFERTAEIYRNLKRNDHLVKPLVNLGNLHIRLGNFETANRHLAEALPLAREVNDQRGIGLILTNLGASYVSMGELDKAGPFLHEALALESEIGNHRAVMIANENLANLHYLHADWAQTRQHAAQGIAAAEKMEDEVQVVRIMKFDALAQLKMGEEAGWAYLKETIERAHASGLTPNVMDVLGGAGLYFVGLEAFKALGLQLLQVVATHPATEKAVERQAIEKLTELKVLVGEPIEEEALELLITETITRITSQP